MIFACSFNVFLILPLLPFANLNVRARKFNYPLMHTYLHTYMCVLGEKFTARFLLLKVKVKLKAKPTLIISHIFNAALTKHVSFSIPFFLLPPPALPSMHSFVRMELNFITVTFVCSISLRKQFTLFAITALFLYGVRDGAVIFVNI